LTKALFFLFGKAETRLPYLSRQARTQVHSFELANPTFKEFRPVQQLATREKYIMVMAKFIQFLLATFHDQVGG
jgi:hypothetical protein